MNLKHIVAVMVILLLVCLAEYKSFGHELLTNHNSTGVIEKKLMINYENMESTLIPFVGKDYAKELIRMNSTHVTSEYAASLLNTTSKIDSSQPIFSQLNEMDQSRLDESQIIKYYMAQLMSKRNFYYQQIYALVQKYRAEFQKLPQTERTEKNRLIVAMQFMNTGISLESKADGEIATLLRLMNEDLSSKGYNTMITKRLKAFYINQKNLERQVYIAKLRE